MSKVRYDLLEPAQRSLRQRLGGFLVAWLVLLGLAAAAPAWAEVDPPGRVGRLNLIQGPVSLSPAGSDEWVEARSTRPLTSGDRIWMGRDARSELSIGSAVLRADEETSLKILQLDDDQAQFQLSEGTLAVQVRSLDPDDRLEIATPNLAFVVDRPGDYRIQVDPDNNITEVMVRRGQGWAYADDGRHRLEAPAYARFRAEGLDQASADLPGRDGFDRWVEARIDRTERRQASRYVSRDLVGYEDLDDYGSWRQEPDYGWIWEPRITVAAWAPYRYGHWAWIAPWGWTWVDDAPWGFAPFHYGRWAYVRSRWCWVPGPVVRRPYYAPALVAFVGSPGGFSLSLTSGPAVAWFPLGPREEYRPVYRASTTYITRINRVVVVERERDGRRGRPDQFVNRYVPDAATALPTRAFVEGRGVGRDRIRVPQGELQRASIAGTMPALAPVKASLVGESRRLAPPPRQDRERPVVTTRMPAPPPVERDELAQRFAQSGNRVREAGPSLAEQPRRTEERDDRRLRLVAPRQDNAPGREDRRPPGVDQTPPPATVEQPGERGRERTLRDRAAQEENARPETREQPRRPPENRDANRPPEAQRAIPEPRRDREEGPRDSRFRQEAPRPPEAAPPQRDWREERQRERAEPQRPAELRPPQEMRREREEGPRESHARQEPARAPEAAPPQRQWQEERQRERAEPQRPSEPRPPQEMRRERPPEPEQRRAQERPAPPQAQTRQEPIQRSEPPREMREQRMEARPEPRGEERGRERREQQRERNDQNPRHPDQPN